MVNSLRKVDFPTLLATIHGKFPPPLRNSWVRPCLGCDVQGGGGEGREEEGWEEKDRGSGREGDGG